MTASEAPDTDEQADLSADLRWLLGILWPDDRAITVSVGRCIPPGMRPVERYAVLPSAKRPRFFLPLESRRAARAALSSYNALRPPLTRWVRRMLAAGVGVGATELAFRDRLTVCVRDDEPPQRVASLLLREHLRRALGDPGLVVAIGMRPPGPYAKPVLQAFSPDGRPCGYVKVGWNPLTRDLVRTEAEFLRARGERPFRTIVVPRLLHRGGWRDLEISITAPLPSGILRMSPSAGLPPLGATREIAQAAGLTEAPLTASSYWSRLRRSLADIVPDDPDLTRPLRRLLQRVEDRYADTRLAFGSWHGDWTPWNVARYGGRIVAWDWEQTGHDVPLGFDVLHYLFQVPFAGRQTGLREAVAHCRRRSAAPLRALGVPTRDQPALLSVYILELFRRYYGAQLAGAGVNRRFYPAVLDLMASDWPE
jgi:hypothetical protein